MATITGPISLTYGSTPYTNTILFRPLSTPLAFSSGLVTGGDFRVQPETNGSFTVDLAAGNYRVFVGADRGFIIDIPDDSNTYTLISRITSALTWTTTIIPSTTDFSSVNKLGLNTISVDASATFTFLPLVTEWQNLLTAPLTSNRAVTLSTTLASAGTIGEFTRATSSTGSSTWSIGGLISLTASDWCRVAFDQDSAAWVLTAFGSLVAGVSGGGGGATPTPFTIYLGKSASTTLDSAGVLGLANAPSVTTLTQTLSYPSGATYIYFCVPAAKNPDQIRSGGFDVDLASTGTYTNTSNGLTYALVTVGGASYRIYRSLNITNGATTVNTH